MTLKGPDNAEHYRVKIGRYNDRWYSDPVPGDSRWPATPDDEAYPAISTVKKAAGSDWTYTALKRIAQHKDPLPAGVDARYAALKNINDLGLREAQKRGTGVHAIAEARLRGFTDPMAEPNSDAELYRPAVDAFFDTYQPQLAAVEFVAIHRDLNGVGYGGTGDAVLHIENPPPPYKPGLYFVDWKSRGVDSDHGAYPEEAAQIAGYACAQYWIVDGPARIEPLPLAGGLIVSIKPDGFRVYPVDLGLAFGHWQQMHAWWVARRDERKPIGRPWAPRKVEQCPETPNTNGSPGSPATSPNLSAEPEIPTTLSPSPAPLTPSSDSLKLTWIRHRIRQLPPDAKSVMWDNWPIGAPRGPAGPFTDQQLDQIHLAVGKAEWQHNIIRPTLEEWVAQVEGGGETSSGASPEGAAPPAFTPPEEGPEVDLFETKKRITALPAEQQALFNRILVEAKDAGRSFHVLKNKGGMPSLRRAVIVDALATIIDAADCDEELIRLALEHVLGQEIPPTLTLGYTIGSLFTTEAARLDELGKGLKAGRVELRMSDDGEPVFGNTAADSAA